MRTYSVMHYSTHIMYIYSVCIGPIFLWLRCQHGESANSAIAVLGACFRVVITATSS